jgi:Domain of unknown function (DUF6538)
MRRWPMLLQRKGSSTYYYRRQVPLALRPLMGGRAQIWKSLRTSDLNEAKLLSLRVGQDVERQLQALQKRARSLQTDPDALARLHPTSPGHWQTLSVSATPWTPTFGPSGFPTLTLSYSTLN